MKQNVLFSIVLFLVVSLCSASSYAVDGGEEVGADSAAAASSDDYSAISSAEIQAMSMGASTLPKGNGAVSFLAGAEFPAPVIWGARFDYGIFDTFQIGAHASYSGVFANGGIQAKYNVFLSNNDHHWLSVEAIFDYSQFWSFGSYKSITIQPQLLYEFRFGPMLGNGIYLGAGAISSMMKGSDDNFLDPFKLGNKGSWEWGNGAKGRLGYERVLSTHWNASIEGGVTYGFSSKKLLPFGQMSITWHF